MGNSETARFGDGREAHDPFALLRPILRDEWRRVLEGVHAAIAAGHMPAPTPRQLAQPHARTSHGSEPPEPTANHSLLRRREGRRRIEATAKSLGIDPVEVALLAGREITLDQAADRRILQKLLVANAIEPVLARETNRRLRAAGRRVGPARRAVLRTHLVAALANHRPDDLPRAIRRADWSRELAEWGKSEGGRRTLEEAVLAAFTIRRSSSGKTRANREEKTRALDTFLRNPFMRATTEPEWL